MEVWKTIPEFPLYQVSDLGNVRRHPEGPTLRGSLRGRVLKPGSDACGYQLVSLFRGGGTATRATRRVHVLVAQAFLGPRPPGHHVRHLDDVPDNNALSNLAYGTPAQNHQDKLRNRARRPSPLTC